MNYFILYLHHYFFLKIFLSLFILQPSPPFLCFVQSYFLGITTSLNIVNQLVSKTLSKQSLRKSCSFLVPIPLLSLMTREFSCPSVSTDGNTNSPGFQNQLFTVSSGSLHECCHPSISLENISFSAMHRQCDPYRNTWIRMT